MSQQKKQSSPSDIMDVDAVLRRAYGELARLDYLYPHLAKPSRASGVYALLFGTVVMGALFAVRYTLVANPPTAPADRILHGSVAVIPVVVMAWLVYARRAPSPAWILGVGIPLGALLAFGDIVVRQTSKLVGNGE